MPNYLINEGDGSNEWRTLYSNAIISCQTIIDKYGNESPYYSGVAKILKAMNLGLATDCWAMCLVAMLPKASRAIFTPKYDPQQQIIQDIQTMLSEAINELQLPNSAMLVCQVRMIIFSMAIRKAGLVQPMSSKPVLPIA